MMRRSIFVSLALAITLISSKAEAQQCSLEGYDEALPKHVSDVTPGTDVSELEWASDVDPDDGGSHSWNYIRNLHERDLALDWKKPKLVIAFDRPLPKGGIFCQRDYGSADAFELDQDAPIYVSGDGEKAARAYVKPQRTSGRAGSVIETNYRNVDGSVSYGLVGLMVQDSAKDGSAELFIRTEPPDVKVAFIPRRVAIDEKSLIEELSLSGAEATGLAPLAKLASFDRSVEDILGADVDDRFIVVSRASGKPVELQHVGKPEGQTPLLLISPDGAVVAATYVDLSGMGKR